MATFDSFTASATILQSTSAVELIPFGCRVALCKSRRFVAVFVFSCRDGQVVCVGRAAPKFAGQWSIAQGRLPSVQLRLLPTEQRPRIYGVHCQDYHCPVNMGARILLDI